jgi:hypothetical protein
LRNTNCNIHVTIQTAFQNAPERAAALLLHKMDRFIFPSIRPSF